MIQIPIIAVVGSKKSGKTTAMGVLVEGLARKGYRVATIKHIPEPGFTIDTKGKDTWRHAEAGAQTVVSVAPNELAIIRKIDTTRYSLDRITRNCDEDVEIILLEGFKKLIGQDPKVPKIIAVKNSDEVVEASKHFKPILTFVGPISTEAERVEIPYVNVLKDPGRLVELVDTKVAGSVEKMRKHTKRLSIRVDEHVLPLNPFVRKFARNTILSMISTLKSVTIDGEEDVSISVRSSSKLR